MPTPYIERQVERNIRRSGSVQPTQPKTKATESIRDRERATGGDSSRTRRATRPQGTPAQQGSLERGAITQAGPGLDPAFGATFSQGVESALAPVIQPTPQQGGRFFETVNLPDLSMPTVQVDQTTRDQFTEGFNSLSPDEQEMVRADLKLAFSEGGPDGLGGHAGLTSYVNEAVDYFAEQGLISGEGGGGGGRGGFPGFGAGTPGRSGGRGAVAGLPEAAAAPDALQGIIAQLGSLVSNRGGRIYEMPPLVRRLFRNLPGLSDQMLSLLLQLGFIPAGSFNELGLPNDFIVPDAIDPGILQQTLAQMDPQQAALTEVVMALTFETGPPPEPGELEQTVAQEG